MQKPFFNKQIYDLSNLYEKTSLEVNVLLNSFFYIISYLMVGDVSFNENE